VNCREVEDLLVAYADGELDLVSSLAAEEHLRDCAACSAALRRLEALHSAVSQVEYYPAPPEFRRKLMGSLEPQTEGRAGVRRDQDSRPATRSRWWAPRLWAVAAAACVCLVTALAVWRTVPGRTGSGLDQEVVASHVRSLLADHLLDVPSSDRHTVKPWFTGKLNFAPQVADLSAQGFELVGGRLDYLHGQRVAALVYRRRQHTINVFTWPAGADESPTTESLQGFHVVHWVSHGMAWWAVSDLAEDELRELARLL